jgi:hypothetical protein
MTNLDKMNELVGLSAKDSEVVNWAYANRIHVMELHYEKEFEPMANSVEEFNNSGELTTDEHENWNNFLSREFID